VSVARWVVAHRLGLASALGTSLVLAPVTRSAAHGDVEARIAHVTDQIALDPDRVDPLLRRAELYRRGGNFTAAEKDLDRAAQVAPTLPELSHQRALLLLAEGDPGRALAVLDGLLAAEPDHVAGHLTRARSLRALDRSVEAAGAYTNAIERARVPTPDPYLERAHALGSSGPAQLASAIAGLDEGIEALGPLPALTRAAVDLELRAGRTDAALTRLEAEITRAHQPLWWWARKGEILDAAGRRAEALDAYAEARRHLDAQPAHRRERRAWRDLEERLTAARDER
jgi:tetratricopeptide (TPR) repeat protein